ncbi:hypothetical protein MIR68_002529 [Amoeboaphelidium protococcarum]|nr:hypothetical protein MIR68_002529 [Amoeboaphelidium protococcarum]
MSKNTKFWIDQLPKFYIGVYLRPWASKALPWINLESKSLAKLVEKEALTEFVPQRLSSDVHVISRVKDRGVLLQLKSALSAQSAQSGVLQPDSVFEAIRQQLKSVQFATRHPFQWLRGRSPRCFQVLGEPFMEDLTTRVPTNRLRVQFLNSQESPSMEALYEAFRQYGKIVELQHPLTSNNKDLPRYALVNYRRIRDAVSAKICLHRYQLGNAQLFIEHEQYMHTNNIRKWVMDHPRVTLPAAGAILVGISYAVFDPIRKFSIQSMATKRFNLSQLSSWFSYDYKSLIPEGIRDSFNKFGQVGQSSKRHGKESSMLSEDPQSDFAGRLEVKQKLQAWLKEPPSSVMLVVGPQGYGKSKLVQSVLADKKVGISINCDETMSRSESDLPPRLARQVGYYPIFSSFVWLQNLLDSLVATSTGSKLGVSTSTDTEIRRILDLTAVALSEIVAKQQQKQKNIQQSQQTIDYPVITINLSDDPNPPPESASNANQRFIDQILQWASALAQGRVAHVIIICKSASTLGHVRGRINKWFCDAQSQRIVEMLAFKDASKEDAERFLTERFAQGATENSEVDDQFIRRVINTLGGRLSDIEALLEKVRAGTDPVESLQDLVSKAVIEVRREGLEEAIDAVAQTTSVVSSPSAQSKKWTSAQFWFVLKTLALKIGDLDHSKRQNDDHDNNNNDGLRKFEDCKVSFDSIKYSAIMDGKDQALLSMENAEFITIEYDRDGHPLLIRPSKPLFRTAFWKTYQNARTRATMDMKYYKELIQKEEKKVKDLEKEMSELSGYLDKADSIPLDRHFSAGESVKARFAFLSRQLQSSQQNIAKYTDAISECKRVIVEQ